MYACSSRDRVGVLESNIKLGFLTGDESAEYLEATVDAGFIVGEPFAAESAYDFAQGNLAKRVSAFAPVLLRDRLTAPPKDAYTSAATPADARTHAELHRRPARIPDGRLTRADAGVGVPSRSFSVSIASCPARF